MRAALIDGRYRPILLAGLALSLILGLIAGPVGEAVEAASQIEVGRERLVRALAVAGRPALSAPLAEPDEERLLARFRERLEGLSGERATVVDRAGLEPDPDRPTLPRLSASLRGTAEGLQGLLHALETEAPLVAVEEVELSIERAADAETGRPTVMRASLIARGVLVPPASTQMPEGGP